MKIRIFRRTGVDDIMTKLEYDVNQFISSKSIEVIMITQAMNETSISITVLYEEEL